MEAPTPHLRPGWRVGWAGTIIRKPWFYRLILALILTELILATVTIATPTCCRTHGTDIAAAVITGTFVCEAVLKICGFGKWYFKDPWNVVDLLSVCADIALNFNRLGDSLYNAFRVVRLLRPMRMIKRIERLGVIVNAILDGIGVLRDFALVLVFLIWPFAIFGTRFIGQNEALTNSATDEGTTNLVLWGDWPSSMLTLFQIATLDWGDIVRGSIHAQPWLGLFFFPFIVVVGFGVTNIFITVVSHRGSNMKCARTSEQPAAVLADWRAVHQLGR